MADLKKVNALIEAEDAEEVEGAGAAAAAAASY